MMTPNEPTATDRTIPSPRVAVVVDVIALVVFFVMGIAAHRPTEGGLLSAVSTTLLLIGGWYAGTAAFGVYRRPAALAPAALAWFFGIPLALVLRTVVRQRPLDPTFVLVTWGLLFALLIGWRLVAAVVRIVRSR